MTFFPRVESNEERKASPTEKLSLDLTSEIFQPFLEAKNSFCAGKGSRESGSLGKTLT